MLPIEYHLFKISYSTHKDEWSINELMIKCIQEEEASNKMNVVSHCNILNFPFLFWSLRISLARVGRAYVWHVLVARMYDASGSPRD